MKSQLVKKLLRRSGYAMLALAALLVLFILEENVRGHIQLARYKADLRAKGEKLTLEELNLPKPTKPSDAAVALLSSGDELRELGKGCPFSVYGIPRPQFVQPGCCLVRRLQPDSGLRLNIVYSEIHRGGRRPYAPGGEETQPQMCSWGQFEEQIDLLREPIYRAREALRQPLLDVPIDYNLDLQSHAPRVTAGSIALWLAAATFDDLHRNRLDGALENVSALAALTHFLQNDRTVISQQERFWMGGVGLNITWEALQAPGWTEERLAKLQTSWEKASVINEFAAAMEGERVLQLDAWESYLRKPMNQVLAWRDISWLSWDNGSGLVPSVLWCLAWKQQDEARGLRLWQRGVDGVRAGIEASAWTMAHKRFEQTYHDEWDHEWSLYDQGRYRMPGPILENSIKRLLEYETQREMTVAAIALERYRLRFGKMAVDLATLVPEFCAKIPRDYMNGSGLHYQLNTDGTWVLYSVGDDGVDNDGDPTPVETRRFSYSIWDGRDAVWPQPVSER